QPAHGTVVINADGTVTYTPDANYSGSDSFTYTISDGQGGTASATVSLTVTGDADNPVALAENVSVAEDGGWIGLNLTATLTDTDGSEALSVNISNVPNGAQLSAGTDLGGGNWALSPGDLSLLSISPPPDFSGDMNLTFSVTSTEADGDFATVDAGFTVTVTPTGDVSVNAADVGVAEDSGDINLGLSANSLAITDADGSETLQSIEISFTNLPAGAVVNNATFNPATGLYSVATAAALAAVSVTAPENWNGQFGANLTVTSNEGSASQNFNVNVSPVNDAPVVTTSPAFTMNEDGTIQISEAQLLAGASDAEGDQLSVANLTVNGGAGTLTGPDDNGNYTYQPAADFSGNISFAYDVSDGTTSVPQTAAISVTAIADTPDASASVTGFQEVYSETAIPVSAGLLAQANSSNEVTISGVPAGAILNGGFDNGDGTWTLSGDLLDGLAVTVPAGYEGSLDLGITLVNPDAGQTQTLIDTDFDNGLGGFTYQDDTFGTDNARYAKGKWDDDAGDQSSGGGHHRHDGGLELKLGGADDDDITDGMSGGFQQSFTVGGDGAGSLTFKFNMDMDRHYEEDEYSDVLVSIDGRLVGLNGNDYIVREQGGGDTGWQTVTLDLGTLSAGAHTLIIGGYNNKSTESREKTEIKFDDLVLTVEGGEETIASENVSFAPDTASYLYAVDLAAALTDIDGSESLAMSVGGLPAGVALSAGMLQADGSWTLEAGDLAGLEVSVPNGNAAFEMTFTATSTDTGGDTAAITRTLDFSDHMGASTDDVLAGTDAAQDTLYGGAGADTLTGEGGDDTLYGGSGDDIISGGADNDTIYGGAGIDTLYGGSGVDYISGGAGGDIIHGDQGNDVIIGGEGNDTLYGGEGADEFVFSLGDGLDTIMDFESGDQITFDGISLNDGDSVDIAASGNDVVVTVFGQDGAQANQVTLKDAAQGFDDVSRENIGDGYSITDTGDGSVTVVVDHVT
ncbi:MAG: tandem-95 repeat protein, partial [Rhodospirillales bacterium]|nr:tandem-95 repeat protein [Rhodospirillales bacterium]